MPHKFSRFLLMPALMASAASAPAQQSNDLSQVVGHMQAVTTMNATFTQTDRNGQSLTGKLLLKRPGHVKFEYQKGVPLLIVADGKALTLVIIEQSNSYRKPPALKVTRRRCPLGRIRR